MKRFLLKPILRLLYLVGGLTILPAFLYWVVTGEDYRNLLEDISYL